MGLVEIATTVLLKSNFGLEPSEQQRVSALLTLPWSLKIVFGLIADNFPIFGSRRKSYMLLLSVLMFVSMALLGYKGMNTFNYAAGLLFTFNFCLAFIDLIREALMVGQARKDPKGGAEEL